MSKEFKVVKANALVEAGYQLTTNEQRLILCAIANIPKNEPINPNVGYCVSKSDFVALGVNPKTANREIREACDRLFNRHVLVKGEQGEFKTRWVQDVTKYDQSWALHNKDFFINVVKEDPYEEDCILASITFSRAVIPLISELKSNFTQYLLSDVSGFSGSYSFRFYEFMMQYKKTGFVRISLDDLRERLDLQNKYTATRDLKIWVIDSAINEINEKSNYKASFKLLKTGKKFTHLELKFKKKVIKKDKKENDRDPNTIDFFSNLTDKEKAIVEQKKAFAEQNGYNASRTVNLINQALENERKAEQLFNEQGKKDRAEKQAQKQKEKEILELGIRQYEMILADDRLINAYIANNGITEKRLSGLQKVRYEKGDFKGVFEMEKHKFEKYHELQRLNLKFLES